MSNIIAQVDDAGLPPQLKTIFELCDTSRYHEKKYFQKDAGGSPLPLEYYLLSKHFSGEIFIGVYPAEKGSKSTQLAALDIDDHTGVGAEAAEELLRRISEAVEPYGMHALISPSKSGTGFHVWFWWDTPQDRTAIGSLFHVILTKLGLKKSKQKGDYRADNGLQVEVRGENGKSLTLPFYNGAPCIDPDTLEPVPHAKYIWQPSDPVQVVTHQPKPSNVTWLKSSAAYFKAGASSLLNSGFDPAGRNNDAHAAAAKLAAGGMDYALAMEIMYQKWEQTNGQDTFPWPECLACLKSAYQQNATESEPMGALAVVPITETLQKDIKPVEWVINDVLPNGYAMLVGAPKKGKSFLALDLAVNIAAGTPFLGEYETTQQGVLYLALEDSERRIKQRVESMKLGEVPEGLSFVYDAPDLESGLIDQLRDTLEQHPDTGVIIIDTLAKIWPITSGKGSVYHAEYKLTDKLKRLADDTGRTVLVIHHENKKGADESIDAVSGSHGVAGTADTIMRLIRHEGHTNATLKIVSRDADADQSLAIVNDGGFKLDTDPHVIHNDKQMQIFQHVLEQGPKTPKQVAEHLGLKYSSVKVWMMRLKDSGHLIPVGGKYDVAEEMKSL